MLTWVFSHSGNAVCWATQITPKWGLWRQKQVSLTWISNCIPQNTVGCNYLSLSEIPASDANVLKGESFQWHPICPFPLCLPGDTLPDTSIVTNLSGTILLEQYIFHIRAASYFNVLTTRIFSFDYFCLCEITWNGHDGLICTHSTFR